ncbi:MAG: hypothetical protein SFV15_01075 [Polyangiaceae bacterium]|nr:hypothetical protein [Polyangiaceae bacterium]
MLSVGAKDIQAASEVARRFDDQELTLTDALGLHIMMAKKIEPCWSTDFHLGLAGARLVIHEP